MSSELAAKSCVPCRGGVPPLKGAELQALAFTNVVGEIAEREGHHPDIYLAWGKVGLSIWTHKIDGLTESDFVLAAKADEAFQRR